MKKKSIITLIGIKQAREGFAFIHQEPSPECGSCQYFSVCIKNLEIGRIYEVVQIRKNVFQCEIHEAGVQVVKVIERDISTTLPLNRVIEGVVITYQEQECDNEVCQNYEYCTPRGLFNGDRCLIWEIGEKTECPKGFSLAGVVLRRIPAS